MADPYWRYGEVRQPPPIPSLSAKRPRSDYGNLHSISCIHFSFWFHGEFRVSSYFCLMFYHAFFVFMVKLGFCVNCFAFFVLFSIVKLGLRVNLFNIVWLFNYIFWGHFSDWLLWKLKKMQAKDFDLFSTAVCTIWCVFVVVWGVSRLEFSMCLAALRKTRENKILIFCLFDRKPLNLFPLPFSGFLFFIFLFLFTSSLGTQKELKSHIFVHKSSYSNLELVYYHYLLQN